MDSYKSMSILTDNDIPKKPLVVVNDLHIGNSPKQIKKKKNSKASPLSNKRIEFE